MSFSLSRRDTFEYFRRQPSQAQNSHKQVAAVAPFTNMDQHKFQHGCIIIYTIKMLGEITYKMCVCVCVCVGGGGGGVLAGGWIPFTESVTWNVDVSFHAELNKQTKGMWIWMACYWTSF